MLEVLGLSADVEMVYRVTLEHPRAEIEKVARLSGLSECEVRRAFDELADLQLLHRSTKSPDDVQPVSPEVRLTGLLAQHELELSSRQRKLEATRAAVSSLTARYANKSGYAPEVVHRLVGADVVHKRLEELTDQARDECLSLAPTGVQAADTTEAGKTLEQKALERGVSIRTIYQESFRNDPAALRHVRWLASYGGLTRTVPTLPMLVVTVDNEVALVPLDPDNCQAGALELRSQGAVAAMRSLFEQFWKAATPWHEASHVDTRGLCRRDRELLHFLAMGNTDEFISRRLGVSLRTVRRRVADLMRRLNARSRFEAGVQAARSGWL
ncbi:LuxR C-terminal-related transcriptional regulator [Streptomyces sp. NBC_01775]|uniref:LuxR C-terminal-related transcriptional regulator n=1 Tax=Streptomyces sp. NBC_01775 TaxID=2975939 RepID=UPI002DDA6C3D|nr:LuxR C-terminal-related transcriptional regulator [Streptomyces sp. NBC_01775]WSB74844.1 LuxR C-terminal-related transcriptional regulator [Streptomyces sp. NBC_01775]